MSIERQAVAALKWSTASKFAAQAIAWVVTLVVIRLLSPEDYGLMALATVFISIIATMAELGLGASIVQAKTITQRELASVGGAILLLNVGLGLLLALSAPLIGAAFADVRLVEVVRVSAVMFVFNALSTVPQSLAYREMRFKWLGGVELAAALAVSAVTLALALSGAGVWALVYGNLAGALVRTAMLIARAGFVRPRFALRDAAQHLRFGWQMAVTRMLWQFVYQLDVVIAGRLLTKEAVGIYSVSLHLANLPMQKVMNVLNQVVFPTVARMQSDLDNLRLRLLQGARLLSFVSVPMLWGISAVAPELVVVVLGERWIDAVFALQAVTLVLPLRMLSIVLASAVSAVGRVDVDLKNNLVSAVLLPAAFLIGAQWGIEGLALSWVVAVPLIFLVNFARMGRVLGLDLRSIGVAMLAPLCAGALMYGAVSGARLGLESSGDLPRFVALIGVGALTYLVAVSLLERRIWGDVRRLVVALKQ